MTKTILTRERFEMALHDLASDVADDDPMDPETFADALTYVAVVLDGDARDLEQMIAQELAS